MITEAGAAAEPVGSSPDLRLRSREPLADERLVAYPLDAPACDGIERRRTQRLAGAKGKARVMPWTADRVTDDQAVGERSVIMRAGRADCVKSVAASNQNGVFRIDASADEAAIRKFVQRNPASEIPLRNAFIVGHDDLPGD